MKKLTLVAVLSLGFLTACSQTVSQNQVFGANVNSSVTVSQVKSMGDDSLVTLQGKILKQISGDKYIFADSTGEITIEIDRRVWNGLNVTPNDTVRIQGEVDKEMFNSSIDVKRIEKVQ